MVKRMTLHEIKALIAEGESETLELKLVPARCVPG